MRAKKLQEELKSILEERERIVEALKVGVNRKTPQTKALKARRSYLALRPGELRAELAPLTGPMYQLFIFFMITDPPTAVTGKRNQVIVAILVAAMESLLRMGNDAGLPLFGIFSAAPAIFGLAIFGPIAKVIDLERGAGVT